MVRRTPYLQAANRYTAGQITGRHLFIRQPKLLPPKHQRDLHKPWLRDTLHFRILRLLLLLLLPSLPEGLLQHLLHERLLQQAWEVWQGVGPVRQPPCHGHRQVSICCCFCEAVKHLAAVQYPLRTL